MLSSVLFNIFIADVLKSVLAHKVKLIDDYTTWKTGEGIREIAAELELDLCRMHNWVHKWRIKIHVNRVLYFFSRILDNIENINISVGGQKI